MANLVCWRCGASLKDLPRPITRLMQCKACNADLHVCRLCRYYNPNHFEKCDHEMAEPAREVDVANFCHYFRPRPDAYNPQEKSRADAARTELEALFGNNANSATPEAGDTTQQQDEKQSAKEKFDSLFKD